MKVLYFVLIFDISFLNMFLIVNVWFLSKKRLHVASACSAKACKNALPTGALSDLLRADVGLQLKGRCKCNLWKHMLPVLWRSTMMETRTVATKSSLMAAKVKGFRVRMDFSQL
ncbi:hypothetical protein CHARACLAT_009952 [Characodon lateralis]|uniref:Secreted protein n=1 Tax=Characodon lateralis TaxID=208331 RepID=A0ABU7DHD1_9TELE|nr:hypothetical protein [Characodon lateralis]